MEDVDTNVVRYAQLFRCNERSYGAWWPPNRMQTIKGHPIPLEAYRAHLEGEVGLGGVPILDDNNCWWAAIDIDTHGPRGHNLNILELASKVEKFKYPLIVCRSKSGGVHLYCFFVEPTPAALVRPQMSRWAAVLGYPEAEIFPKQANLDSPLGGEKPMGNWINLPYYKVDGSQRYCVSGGREVGLEYFLELAEGRRHRIVPDDAATDEYSKGPPCLQGMIRVRVDEGGRNNALFQASVFLKRAFPHEWKVRVQEFNAMALATPLNSREARQIISSVGRKDYNYKCREEPCKSLCDRELCRTREYGITDEDTKANELPPFDRIEKVISTPIRWVLHIQNKQIEMTSQQLFDFGAVRIAVYESLNLLLPRMKQEEWDTHLREVATRAKVRYETTVDDIIFHKLCDFLRRAQHDRALPEDDRRLALVRKMPALISISNTQYKVRGQVDEQGAMDEIGHTWYYAFRAQDFIDNMRRHKSLTVMEHQVHTILHRLLGDDAMRDRFRAGDKTLRNVWCVPEQDIATEQVPEKIFKPEF